MKTPSALLLAWKDFLAPASTLTVGLLTVATTVGVALLAKPPIVNVQISQAVESQAHPAPAAKLDEGWTTYEDGATYHVNVAVFKNPSTDYVTTSPASPVTYADVAKN